MAGSKAALLPGPCTVRGIHWPFQLGYFASAATAMRRILIEEARRANTLGSSLQAAVALPLKPEHESLLNEAEWAEIAIVSGLTLSDTHCARRGKTEQQGSHIVA